MYKGMMETIEIGKCLSELPAGNAGKIVGLNGNNCVLTTSNKIVDEGGCGLLNIGTLSTGKWYRIAIGAFCNYESTMLINIGKRYNTNPSSSQLFYVFADGYSGNQFITCLAGSSKSITKARILYKSSVSEKVILDMYISSPGNNDYHVAYSNNLGFVFSQKVVEAPNEPDAGYSVKEFTF